MRGQFGKCVGLQASSTPFVWRHCCPFALRGKRKDDRAPVFSRFLSRRIPALHTVQKYKATVPPFFTVTLQFYCAA
jgi:hypothetical protein